MNDEHDYCPSCNADFDGELIFDTFMKQYNDRKKALETAEMYGATETKGRWSKKIGIYDMDKDRTISWQCHECGHRWDR
jgi:hypothetical protein